MFKKIVNSLMIAALVAVSVIVPQPNKAEAANYTPTSRLFYSEGSVIHTTALNGSDKQVYADGAALGFGAVKRIDWQETATPILAVSALNSSMNEATFIVDPGTGAVTSLPLADASWSPDGESLVGTRTSDSHLVIMNKNGTLVRELTTAPAFGADWSLDGQIVFVASDSAARGQVNLINPDGTNRRTLTSGTTGYSDPRFAPAGDAILVNANVAGGQGWNDQNYTEVLDPADGTILGDISDPAYWLGGAVYSPDVTKIAYNACAAPQGPAGTCQNHVYLMDADGANLLDLGLSTGTITWGPDLDLMPVNVHRFWSSKFGNAHFFTTNEAEKDHLVANDRNWAYEGAAFGAYAPAGNDCRMHDAVYRFWSAKFKTHFFTSNAAEKDHLIANDRNWSYEGVAYCADLVQQPGQTALYRFWSSKFKKHHFTADPAEMAHLRDSDRNWSYEGIAYYVLP